MNPGLNQLQIAMIKSGLVKEEEVLDIIHKKREQARKTRLEIKKIISAENVSRSQAVKILQKRRKQRRRKM